MHLGGWRFELVPVCVSGLIEWMDSLWWFDLGFLSSYGRDSVVWVVV